MSALSLPFWRKDANLFPYVMFSWNIHHSHQGNKRLFIDRSVAYHCMLFSLTHILSISTDRTLLDVAQMGRPGKGSYIAVALVNLFLPSVYCNGACRLAAVVRATILVPCHVVKSLQLIWRSGTRRWNLRVPDLQMRCSDLTQRVCQDRSPCNDRHLGHYCLDDGLVHTGCQCLIIQTVTWLKDTSAKNGHQDHITYSYCNNKWGLSSKRPLLESLR